MTKKLNIIIFALITSCGPSTQYAPGKSLRLSQVEVMSIGNEKFNARLDAVCIDKGEQIICATSVDEHHQGQNDIGIDLFSIPVIPDSILGKPASNDKEDCYSYKYESLALAKNGYVVLSFGGVLDIQDGDTLNIHFISPREGFPCTKVLHRVTAILEDGERVHLCDPVETEKCIFRLK